MQARYVILFVLLKNALGLVSIKHLTGSDDNPDVLVQLDRTKIELLGKPAIGDFLMKLQVWCVSLTVRLNSYAWAPDCTQTILNDPDLVDTCQPFSKIVHLSARLSTFQQDCPPSVLKLTT